MEVSIFPLYPKLMDRYVEVRMDTDPTEPRADEYGAYQERLTGVRSRPTYVVVDPDKPNDALAIQIGTGLPLGQDFDKFLRDNAGG
jgi:hypothetical protein